MNPTYYRRWWRLAIVIALALVVTSMTPLMVTVDGYLYLQSSIWVFSDHALTGYNWVREPLYPLILRFERELLGSADTRLIFVQALASGAAAQLAGSALIPRRPRAQVALIVLVMLNPITMMYAGSALQTTWIMLSLAANTWIVARCWRNPRPNVWLMTLVLMVTIVFSTYLSFQLGYMALSTGIAAGVGLVVRWNNRRDTPLSYWRTASVATLAAVILGAASFGIASAALKPWHDYKAQTLAGTTTDTDGVITDSRGLPVAWEGHSPVVAFKTTMSSPIDTIEGMFGHSIRFLSLNSDVIDENAIYTDVIFAWRCGALEDASFLGISMTEGRAQVTPSCRSDFWLKTVDPMKRMGRFLLQLSSVGFLVGLIVLLPLRRFGAWFALLPTVQFLLMYALINGQTNRYGFPIYPLGLALVLLGLATLAPAARRVVRGAIIRQRTARAEPH